jgi:urease accessory protein
MGTIHEIKIFMNNNELLNLLQLTSPSLPVGAYSYSEGLESLVEEGWITNAIQLEQWILESLATGSIALEAAVLLRAHRAWMAQDLERLAYWNHWLSATRETMELQRQSWQMGRSLLKLLQDIYNSPVYSGNSWVAIERVLGDDCNFAIAFTMAAGLCSINEQTAVIGYLYSWASNLVNAGVKLIPLGQTAGQRLVMNLQQSIVDSLECILFLPDDQLYSCSWGLALASMTHETQYSRLFRS